MSKPKIEKPESSKKFTDEELQEVKEIQQNYVEIQHRLGQLSVAKIRLEQQQDALGKQEDTLTGKFKEAQSIYNFCSQKGKGPKWQKGHDTWAGA